MGGVHAPRLLVLILRIEARPSSGSSCLDPDACTWGVIASSSWINDANACVVVDGVGSSGTVVAVEADRSELSIAV